MFIGTGLLEPSIKIYFYNLNNLECSYPTSNHHSADTSRSSAKAFMAKEVQEGGDVMGIRV